MNAGGSGLMTSGYVTHIPCDDLHSSGLASAAVLCRTPTTPCVSSKRARYGANRLAQDQTGSHALRMFLVSEAEAAAIRRAYEESGELAAAVELRRYFPGIADNASARLCARTIASWTPLPVAERCAPKKRRKAVR